MKKSSLITKILSLLIAVSFVSSVARAEGDEMQMSPSDAATQKAAGFLLKETTNKYQKFSFRDLGNFIISKDKFQTRAAALAFCQSQEGYDLETTLMALGLTFTGLPFADLQASSFVMQPVIGSQNQSGIIFWIKGQSPEEEAALAAKPDMVYAFENGCGEGCGEPASLSEINSRLQTLKKPTLSIQAICADADLRKNLAN